MRNKYNSVNNRLLIQYLKYYNIITIIINIIEIMMNKLIIIINNYEEIETIKNWIIQSDSFSSIILIINMNILF